MKKKVIPYHPALKPFARALRRRMTLSEVLLWERIRRGQICGARFRRQKPLLRYIVDFYCDELELVIEVDGASHDLRELEDKVRDAELQDHGVHVLRVWDRDVRDDIDRVLKTIKDQVEALRSV